MALVPDPRNVDALIAANACSDPDLFWALKRGGGGSFGMITSLTLRTHDLPDFFGVANVFIEARSDGGYRRLIRRFVDFAADALVNPHGGETAHVRDDNVLRVSMVLQGLDQAHVEAARKLLLDFVHASRADYAITAALEVMAFPACVMWNPDAMRRIPGLVVADSRPGAPPDLSGKLIRAHPFSTRPARPRSELSVPEFLDWGNLSLVCTGSSG